MTEQHLNLSATIAAQRSWYRRTPTQTRTPSQTTEIANPTAGIDPGHLSMILLKADLTVRIDCNPRQNPNVGSKNSVPGAIKSQRRRSIQIFIKH